VAHAAVSRRPPVSFSRIVARTEGYTYAAKIRALSIVQQPLSVPRAKPSSSDSQLLHRCMESEHAPMVTSPSCVVLRVPLRGTRLIRCRVCGGWAAGRERAAVRDGDAEGHGRHILQQLQQLLRLRRQQSSAGQEACGACGDAIRSQSGARTTRVSHAAGGGVERRRRFWRVRRVLRELG
jgi:hypothetical protein